MNNKFVMALDAGTTCSRCIIFNKKGEVCSLAQKNSRLQFPKPGYVEHDATELWSTQLGVAVEAMSKLQITYENIETIGISTQRETTILWDKNTGQPVYNAIVWQCRRTSSYCDILKEQGYAEKIRKKTGLVIDAYFSATKIKWILDNVKGVREKAENGEILFGTVDSWLLWNLTKGKVHATDYSNASRTMLFNINTLKWDQELLELFDIPEKILPEVYPSSHYFGDTDETYFNGPIKITAMAGDQQAALFGQLCFDVGDIKATYGTGGFMLMNIGQKPIYSRNGLITTIAWNLNGETTYALEGSIFVAGSAIKWLKDDLRIIDTEEDSEYMASRVPNTGDCYVVPAFTGLGAPYWDQYSRGTIVGITRGITKYHFVRATLESIAYLTNDLFDIMQKDSKTSIKAIKVDGGVSNNNFVMQFLADITGIEVYKPSCIESSARGVCYLAGLQTKFWRGKKDISKNNKVKTVYKPSMKRAERTKLVKTWKKAVTYSFGWAKK